MSFDSVTRPASLARMLAAPHGDDLRQDRDRDLVRRDRAEVEAGGRLELRQTLGGDAALSPELPSAPRPSCGCRRTRRSRHRPRAQRATRPRRRGPASTPRHSARRHPRPAAHSLRCGDRHRRTRACSAAGAHTVTAKPVRLARSATATATGLEPQITTCGRGSTGSTKMSIVPWLGHMFLAKRTPLLLLAGFTPLVGEHVGRLHRDEPRACRRRAHRARP